MSPGIEKQLNEHLARSTEDTKGSPAERARAVYDQEACARSFVQDVELHMLHGYVFASPDYFIMGRGVNSDASDVLVVNPAFIFPRESQDCWMVYLAAGKNAYRQFFKHMPYPLPLVCWERKNKLRYYSLEDVMRKTCNSD